MAAVKIGAGNAVKNVKDNKVKPQQTSAPVVTLPDTIINKKNNKKYARGKLLGKGGFAKCYEVTDLSNNQVIAMKVVPKSLLIKEHQKAKMAQEISIHRELHHKHIVQFIEYFEDNDCVYILLELCSKKSLMELHKRRQHITDIEAKYFFAQLCLGIKYLHDLNIIHRDLKLGNLFLNDSMDIKIGDFGLATRIEHNGERKRTLCGTPNYIAPEVLTKKGHSFEVDIWSMGCILYTLLVGRPPFETHSLNETYKRIKNNSYQIPSHSVSNEAAQLISKLLQDDPIKRPSIVEILKDDYLAGSLIPKRLPMSCLTMAPRVDQMSMNNSIINLSLHTARKPLTEINKLATVCPDDIGRLPSVPENEIYSSKAVDNLAKELKSEEAIIDNYTLDLQKQLNKIIASKPSEKKIIQEDEAEKPQLGPIVWISKWVDYSDKYGLGWQLSDDSIGVLFNDHTKILLHPNEKDIHYIERNGNENYYTIQDYPLELKKKVTLLKYFQNYMREHLLKMGASVTPRDGDELSRIPCLKTWFRTRSAIVLQLNNGTLQINFFQDHTKLIICPLMGAITYVDKSRNFRTFKLSLIEQYGCSAELFGRLRYARIMVERLLTVRSGSSRMKNTAE